MATLSSDELADLQADLGIGSDGSVFSDEELDRLYTRATTLDGARVYALDQLLMNAAKFNDYTAGSSTEKKSQVFAQLMAMRTMWARRTGIGLGEMQAGVIDLDFMDKSD